ncbi:MAG: High-affinity nickel-transporter, partial [Actinobacteria bacterium]|nr:High-affinity nickel-transporter [Actinomycetota bacterium]
MRRRIVLAFALALAILGLLVVPAVATAHPLGNFTTNQYVEVIASGDRLYVVAVLDLAEIPTFQAKAERDRLGRAPYASSLAATLRRGLELRVDGAPRRLTEIRHRLAFPPGVASLRTTRLEVVLDGGTSGSDATATVEISNSAFASRIGWKELVVRAERGAELASSTVPTASVSDRLRAYPKSLLKSPLNLTSASVRVEGGDTTGVEPRLSSEPISAPMRDAGAGTGGFASLIERDDLSIGFVLVALVLALFWGAAHALTPGHGKAIVAAYLMGTKGRPRDALALGGIVTVTHTIGVFALGIATLALSEFIVPEDLYPWMNLISAILVVSVGVVVVRQRVLAARGRDSGHHHHHHGSDDHHHHGHGHHGHSHADMTPEEHARAHLPAPGSGKRGLIAVGISGGLLPCPTALVVLLAAISLHRVAFGLVLIVAFSIGLASVISAIGLIAIGARSTFKRVSFEGRIVRALPAVS